MPPSWGREANLRCTCEGGRALAQFLGASRGRFPIRKERRQHLHRKIDGHGCDCTHVTERKGIAANTRLHKDASAPTSGV